MACAGREGDECCRESVVFGCEMERSREVLGHEANAEGLGRHVGDLTYPV